MCIALHDSDRTRLMLISRSPITTSNVGCIMAKRKHEKLHQLQIRNQPSTSNRGNFLPRNDLNGSRNVRNQSVTPSALNLQAVRTQSRGTFAIAIRYATIRKRKSSEISEANTLSDIAVQLRNGSCSWLMASAPAWLSCDTW